MSRKKVGDKLKKRLLFVEDKFPAMGKPMISVLRLLRFAFYYKPIFYISRWGRRKSDVYRIHWIDPGAIQQYVLDNKLNSIKSAGKVLDGDWDLAVGEFKNHPTYRGLTERFGGSVKKRWEDTEFYRSEVRKIKNGEIVRGCGTVEKFREYLNYVDELYESIKHAGYQPNAGEANPSIKFNKTDPFYQRYDEITVSINRYGEPLFNDGGHRLAIAKILGLKKVAAIILIRHKKWADFRNEIHAYAQEHRGVLYQPAYHFDLGDVPYRHGEERFKLMQENLTCSKGKVLDIGANIGYFCHKFEELGFDSYAVEINPQDVYFMQKLRRANRDKFQIIRDSIFDLESGRQLDFDVVMALNIFHHFLKRQKTYEELRALLGRLNCKELFLETHNPEEGPMLDAYRNYSPDDFVDFVVSNSRLKKHKLILELEGNRRLYKIFN